MPLAVEIVLVIIGVGLLALALIGSGISRRLMTIPKMRRAPRVVLAILGVLLLAGGMWGLSTGTKEDGPSMADLKAHIPDDVLADLHCTEGTESPEGAVKMECTGDSVPEYAEYIMFADVNDMQDYWVEQVNPEALTGDQCNTVEDHRNGSRQTYFFDERSVTIGDEACYATGSDIVALYTDRRFNIVVGATIPDAQHFSDFRTWVDETSQPVGDEDATPETPSHTP